MARSVLTSIIGAMILGCGAAAANGYSVNGQPAAAEMAKLLAHYGFEPGAYYVDANGNYGRTGAAPLGNIGGGPVRNWSGQEPSGVAGNPYAQAYVNGVVGVRVFWVYSPSMFSEAKGGSSGYVHICPQNVYRQTSEGAINVGGDYNSQYGQNESWAGVAGTSSGAGRWGIEDGPQGPVLALYGSDGGARRVPIATMLQGRWEAGGTTYAVEQGKAAC